MKRSPKRRTPLKRGAAPQRKTRIKTRGKPRFKRGRDEAFLERVREMPCAFCRLQGRIQQHLTEPEHIKTRGAGGTDRGNVVPGCAYHREMRHTKGLSRLVRIAQDAGTSIAALIAMTEAVVDE
jgi:hypothetical protein